MNGRETVPPPYVIREDAERAAAEGAGGVLVFETSEAAAFRPTHIARLERMKRRDSETVALLAPEPEVPLLPAPEPEAV